MSEIKTSHVLDEYGLSECRDNFTRYNQNRLYLHATALAEQLAAERARVALADKTLRSICEQAEGISCASDITTFAVTALITLQSGDALADLRREVARAIVEVLVAKANDHNAEFDRTGNEFNHGARNVLNNMAKYIRAKFGVTE